MKVWIVRFFSNMDGDQILGVYSSEEKAQNAWNKILKEWEDDEYESDWDDEITIFESEIDRAPQYHNY